MAAACEMSQPFFVAVKVGKDRGQELSEIKGS